MTEPATRWDRCTWDPLKPSCFDCRNFDEGTEYGDYGVPLSYDPGCLKRREYYDNDKFPFNIAPLRCVLSGNFVLNIETAFFKSPFCENMDGSDECLKAAVEGFIWWLENIGAKGI